jgi:hypothetical protein
VTISEEAIIVHQALDGRCYLDMMEWPKYTSFSGFMVRRHELARMSRGYIEVKLVDARAFYRINNFYGDTYHCTLVYSEGPDAG